MTQMLDFEEWQVRLRNLVLAVICPSFRAAGLQPISKEAAEQRQLCK